ncbi:hypothetical protein EHP00_1059 [Ecytonucleospora hepatopenaei]|uniref:Uncharacterized protein n=1 Tax=Ecytonucleospora hepatopenaei TaxID=646526 RepID=A0A1W0E5I4_9MICR|nr:hypothetical protein EHP00_1059 [Ecytonucleospora hepatopenaei]
MVRQIKEKLSEEWDDYDIVASYYDSNSETSENNYEDVIEKNKENSSSSVIYIESQKAYEERKRVEIDISQQNSFECEYIRNACSNVDEISEDTAFLRKELQTIKKCELTRSDIDMLNNHCKDKIEENTKQVATTDSEVIDVNAKPEIDLIYDSDKLFGNIKNSQSEEFSQSSDVRVSTCDMGFKKNVNIVQMNIKFKNDPVTNRKVLKKSYPSEKFVRDEESEIVREDIIDSFLNVRNNEIYKHHEESKPNKKFVFGKVSALKHIKDVTDTYEFKYGELYDKLKLSIDSKKGAPSFTKVKGCKMFFYDSHSEKNNKNIEFSSDNYFTDPEHKKNTVKYKKLAEIDLPNANIYFNTEFKGFFKKCCSVSSVDKAYLLLINDIVLDDVLPCNKGVYIVQYRIGGSRKQLKIQNLEFIVEYGNVLYSCKCDDHKLFMSWVVSILLRQGKEVCAFSQN